MGKYCTNCHKLMDADATFCVECGNANKGEYKDDGVKSPYEFNHDREMMLPLMGFIFSFIIPLPGLVLSIIGLVYSTKHDNKGKKYAIAGIIIAACRMTFWIVIQLILNYKK